MRAGAVRCECETVTPSGGGRRCGFAALLQCVAYARALASFLHYPSLPSASTSSAYFHSLSHSSQSAPLRAEDPTPDSRLTHRPWSIALETSMTSVGPTFVFSSPIVNSYRDRIAGTSASKGTAEARLSQARSTCRSPEAHNHVDVAASRRSRPAISAGIAWIVLALFLRPAARPGL